LADVEGHRNVGCWQLETLLVKKSLLYL
jgi:hypothetical protein